MTLLQLDTSFFFAFGAFHFVGGQKTVLNYVESAGYTITQIGSNDETLLDSNDIFSNENIQRLDQYNSTGPKKSKNVVFMFILIFTNLCMF